MLPDPTHTGRFIFGAFEASLKLSTLVFTETLNTWSKSVEMWSSGSAGAASRLHGPAWHRVPEQRVLELAAAPASGREHAATPFDVMTGFWSGWLAAVCGDHTPAARGGSSMTPAAPASLPMFPFGGWPAAAWPFAAASAGWPSPVPSPLSLWWPAATLPPALPGWWTAALQRLGPADAMRAMMPTHGQPAWPMAFAFIGLGMPREWAWPAAELGSTWASAAQDTATAMQKSFSAYRSDGGHALAQVLLPDRQSGRDTGRPGSYPANPMQSLAWMTPPWMAWASSLSRPG